MKNAEALGRHFPGEWREHPGHTGYYFSREGEAASWNSSKPRRLIGCECGRGYRAVSVPDGDGRYGRVYIHRAVCELFNGGYGIGLHCRHLDTDMTNNAASNLAWGTPLENAADGVANGKFPEGHASPHSILTAEQAKSLRDMRQEGLTFKQLGNLFGVARMTAHRVCTLEQWK